MDHIAVTKNWPGEAEVEADESLTVNDFMQGEVRLIQHREGYRVSMDTMMLAAAVPARTGERVIEGGVGSGGASIFLAHRVPGVTVNGIEIQDDLLNLARRNIAFNQLEGRVNVTKGSVTDLSTGEGTYDHAMINPPYLAEGTAIRPPGEIRGIAHMDSSATLKDWINFCLFKVRYKGTITIVFRADRLDEVISRLHRRVGDMMIMPLWPRAGQAAKRVIIQGRKGVHGAPVLLPGLVLHGDERSNTPEAEAILRFGGPLDLKAFASGRHGQ